jgi:plasmid stabilization system protein ParE
MVVRWSKAAAAQLKTVYNYIKKDSLQNALKVRDDIVKLSQSLTSNPEMYPPDKFKLNNDGCYRAVEIYHYRLSYKILQNEILIVRLRHTAMSPIEY